MKKCIALVVGAVVLCSQPGLSMAEGKAGLQQPWFQEELHTANKIRFERQEIKQDILQKKDELLQLRAHRTAAKQAAALTEERKQLKELRTDLMDLQKKSAQTRKEFKVALREQDHAAAKQKMASWLQVQQEINVKMKEKVKLMDAMIVKLKS
ncbi:hypothetical protein ACFQPF_08200 [Fictibacillus iocasae]|uniref:Uncharacterized protein n=1 Tax=Fictibacillus iocasae TaxID=2715437 RepID=A0ABW2NSM0_9BACL